MNPKRLAPRALFHLAGLLMVIGLVVGPAIARAGGLPTNPGPLSDAEQHRILEEIDAVGRRGFLYQVTRPDARDEAGQKKLFLYGTIHLGRVGSEPFNAAVLGALRQSTRLALEADPTDVAATQALAVQLGQYPEGDGLQRHVAPALMERARVFGAQRGIAADQVDRFRPWLLANMISLTGMSSSGLDPMLGSELYLSGFARRVGMPIVEIEGLEAQLRLLAGLPDAMQIAELDEALTALDSAEVQDQTRELFRLWQVGDAPAGESLITEMHRDAEDKAFERYFVDHLIDRRNRTMADRAEHYLERPGSTFFAIGALHLFGEAGLIREFERRGYRVVDLQPPPATAAP